MNMEPLARHSFGAGEWHLQDREWGKHSRYVRLDVPSRSRNSGPKYSGIFLRPT